MKILIVCDVLGKENNGTTIAAMNLIRYLKSVGEDVRILCADQDKINDENTFVVPNIYLGKVASYILKKNNVNLAKPVKKIIEEAIKDVDIVHVLLPFALGCHTAKLAKKKGIPVTASFHCQAENFTSHILHTMNSKLINKQVYKIFYKKLYRYADAIHYPTEFIHNTFECQVKHKTNAYVISNGVNDRYVKKEVEKPVDRKDKFNILFIGRLSKEKSHNLLLEAVSKSKYRNNIKLIFAGQGPCEKKIISKAKALRLEQPSINFYSRDELVNVINTCDLYVHPAEIEIEAISCLEAITCGLVPVISDSKRSATNAFALSEKNLFNHKNIQDLADKIDYWIEHPEEKKACSEQYLGYTKKFNQTECMKKMHTMLLTYASDVNHTTKKKIYYRDELNDDFANKRVISKPISSNYKYHHRNPFYKFFSFVFYYAIAKPVVFLINKTVYHQKFVNNLKCRKKELKGAFIYANHTLGMGDAYTPNLIFSNRNNIIVSSCAVSIPVVKTMVSMLGGIPLSSTLQGTRAFLKEIENRIEKGQSITIYPEMHIWPYYTKIRNFPSGAFKYPVDLNRPVICLTNTYQRRGKHIRLVTYIDGPFYPTKEEDKRIAREILRNEVYETMVKRSNGCDQIEKNKYINLNDIEITY